MGYFDELEYDVKTEELSEKIEKAYNHYNARISIEAWKILRAAPIRLTAGTRSLRNTMRSRRRPVKPGA